MDADLWCRIIRYSFSVFLVGLLFNTDVLLRLHHSAVDAATSMSVSQCSTAASDSNGRRIATPKLTLRCPSGHVIHISRSFHGARRLSDVGTTVLGGHTAMGLCPSTEIDNALTGSRRCSYCEGDCIDESIGAVYDWSSSSCTGRETCSRAVLQSHMPHCPPPSLGGDTLVRGQSPPTAGTHRTSWNSVSNQAAVPEEAFRSQQAEVRRAPIVVRPVTSSLHQKPEVVDQFSDYLQVDYDCVDRSKLMDVCGSARESVTTRVVRGGGHLVSPGYLTEPVGSAYPLGVDCMCRLQMLGNRVLSLPSSSADGPKLHVAIYDMLLETKRGRCQADWVMVRLPNGEKHRHCGAISTGSKLVASSNDVVDVQFHSDNIPDDNLTHSFSPLSGRPLKGFWFHFFAVPNDIPVHISCHRLNASDPRVTEIRNDDVTSDAENGYDITTVSTSRGALAADSAQHTGLFELASTNGSHDESGNSRNIGGTPRPSPRESRLTFFGFGGCSHDNASHLLIAFCLIKAVVAQFW